MTYSLADMTKAGRCTERACRWWEQQGLLPGVERSEHNYRRYSLDHIRRAKIIAACQLAGMKIGEIKVVLRDYDAFSRQTIAAALRKIAAEAITLMSDLPFADEPELDL